MIKVILQCQSLYYLYTRGIVYEKKSTLGCSTIGLIIHLHSRSPYRRCPKGRLSLYLILAQIDKWNFHSIDCLSKSIKTKKKHTTTKTHYIEQKRTHALIHIYISYLSMLTHIYTYTHTQTRYNDLDMASINQPSIT